MRVNVGNQFQPPDGESVTTNLLLASAERELASTETYHPPDGDVRPGPLEAVPDTADDGVQSTVRNDGPTATARADGRTMTVDSATGC